MGGISRTIRYKGFFFDIGGHRFFSKSKIVEDLWTEIPPDDFIHRPRKSRIYDRRRFFSYPLKAFEALFNLGMLESVRCVLSYGAARLRPIRPVRSFEDWVVNKFGRRLFEIFFKTYTEKVWGMSCKEISADWAAQRIKGLSLLSAVLHAVLPRREPRDRSQVVKTLIDSFRYPRLGPGQMWEAARDRIRAGGGRVLLGHAAIGLARNEATEVWTVRARTASGEERRPSRPITSSHRSRCGSSSPASSNQTRLEVQDMAMVTDQVVEHCIDHPKENLLPVFEKYRKAK